MKDNLFQDDPIGRFHKAVMAPRKLGVIDCFLSVADVILPAWNADLMEGLRGSYASYGEIRRLLAASGHSSAIGLINERAVNAGGTAMPAGAIEERAGNLDLGFLLVEDWHPSLRKLLGGMPAFFWAGKWVAMTHDGMVVADPDRAAFAWARPGDVSWA